MYCLWLNGKKISNPSEIRTNYDSEALRGYFLGGSLIKWLKMAGDEQTAEKVNLINVHGDIDKSLAEAFGLITTQKVAETVEEIPTQLAPFSPLSSFFSVNGSFNALSSSFEIAPTSFELSSSFSSFSFSANGSFVSSFSSSFTFLSSFNTLSSFSTLTSFSSSFTGAGSFSVQSSFETSSFGYGSFIAIKAIPEMQVTEEEKSEKAEEKPLTPEKKILINLSSCPLNRFGYGIHLV